MLSTFLTQEYGKLAYADIAMIIIYMLTCLYIGAKAAGQVKTLRQYALGTGPISTVALIATMYATHLGAGSTIGILEKITELGLPLAIIIIFLTPVQWLLSIYIFGKNIEQFQGCITISDIMYRLYGNLGKTVTCITDVIYATAIVAAQTMAFSYCLEYFLNIPFVIGVLIGTFTIVFYSVLGGIRAVVITDIFQFAIFYIVVPVICGIIIQQTGGWNNLVAVIKNEESLLNVLLDTNHPHWLALISYAIFERILPYNNSAFMQRFLMCNSSKQLRKVLWGVILIDISISTSLSLLGLILSDNVNEQLGAKAILEYMLNKDLFIFIKGVSVIGILAVIMSTADSYLNISAVMLTRNVFKQAFPNISDVAELRIARFSTITIGFCATILALYGSGVLSLIWIGLSIAYPIITPPIIFGFSGFRTNSLSFCISIILAILGNIIGYYIQGELELFSLLFGCVGSAIGLFGGHYIQKVLGVLGEVAPQEEIELRKWYEEKAIELKVPLEKVPVELARIKCLREEEENQSMTLSEKLDKVWQCVKLFRFRDIIFYSQNTVAKYGERYYELAIIAVLFCVYNLMFSYVVSVPNVMYQSSITLRIFITLASISGGMPHLWEEEMARKYKPLYFHIMVMLIFPFLSTYTYLIYPEGGIKISVLSIFCASLMVDWYTFCIIMPIGFILGNLLYILAGYIFGVDVLYINTLNGALVYLILAMVAAFLLRFVENNNTNRLYINANHDALTGVYNRHYLEAKLKRLIQEAKARNKKLSIIAIDLDKFKQLNDIHGHNVGDMALKYVGKLIDKQLRPLDMCVRIGGDEFLIILPNIALDKANAIASRIKAIVESASLMLNDSLSIKVSLSFGVAELAHEDTQESFINKADMALYKSKVINSTDDSEYKTIVST